MPAVVIPVPRDPGMANGSVDLKGDVQAEHIRRMLNKIVERKDGEKIKAVQVERYLKQLSACLFLLLGLQFVLNLGQTTVFAGVDKRVLGVLSAVASVNTFVVACLGKLALNARRALQRHTENQRRWDKAEDAFIMELSASLDEDGRLTIEEHRKLREIYTQASDFVDGSMSEEDLDAVDKKILRHIKDHRGSEDGSRAFHPADP